MDLKSVLNTDGDDHHASSTAHKRPLPPPLTTHRPASQHNGVNFESPIRTTPTPSVQYSPGPPHSANSYTSTPHTFGSTNLTSPYSRSVPLPSPGGRPASTPKGYFLPGERPPSHHSIARNSSTSPFEQQANFNKAPSPSLVRHYSFQQQPIAAHNYNSQPHTPLGPPSLPRGNSTNTLRESPLPYGRHQRVSSGPTYDQQNGSPPSSGHPLHVPTNVQGQAPVHLNGSPDIVRQSTSYTSRRTSSLSVSPKTIVERLPTESESVRRSTSMSTPTQPEPSSTKPSITPSPSGPAPGLEPPVPQYTIKSEYESTTDPKPDTLKQHEPVSLKRSALEAPAEPAPAKRARVIKEPPIWARPKKGIPPIRMTSGHPINAAASTAAEVRAVSQPVGNIIADNGIEPSFTNIVPFEDLTRQIGHFLFVHVVQPMEDAPIEIEAKIGRLLEGGTRDRLHMNVQTETIVGSNVDVSFESQLLLSQHAALNQLLNQNLVQSRKPWPTTGKPRIPMDYRHTREIDSFYDLPPSELLSLPIPVQNQLRINSARFKPKLRITRDEKTGEVTAAIIKIRVADINVYCPQSNFDWRISVNLEHKWNGDPSTLSKATDGGGHHGGSPPPDRRKDRMSYTHQFCQIDLTQVKADAVDGHAKGGKQSQVQSQAATHELEVEIDTAALRQQGNLVKDGRPSKYEDYVRVFLDNVRTLARAIPKTEPM